MTRRFGGGTWTTGLLAWAVLVGCPDPTTTDETNGSSSSGGFRRGSSSGGASGGLSSGGVGSSGGSGTGGSSLASSASSVGTASSVGATSAAGSNGGSSASLVASGGGSSAAPSSGTTASSAALPSSSIQASSSSATGSSSTANSSSSAAVTSSSAGGASSSSGGVNTGGDTCALAQQLTVGTPLNNQTTVGKTNDYTLGSQCQLTDGRDVVYAVNVPANTTWRVTLTPVAPFDPTLSVVDGAACVQSPTCVARADAGAGGEPEAVDVVNNTAAAKTFYVIVDSYLVGQTGGFSIRADVVTPVGGGETCSAPQVLTAGTLLGLTTMGFAVNHPIAVPGLCRAQGGPDRVFQITIPANRRLRVVATPVADTFDLVLNLKDPATCTSTNQCLESSDDGVEGDPETLLFDNPGAETTVLLVLGSYPGSSASLNGGVFDLTVTMLAIP